MNKEKKQRSMTLPEMRQVTEEIMRELGVSINAALSTYFPNSGFILITFPVGKPGTCNYISNAERSSMVDALKETAMQLEQKKDIPDIPKPVGTIH